MQYIDGTKIESVANKYTFVWRGSVEKNDARLKAKTEALRRQIEQNHTFETQENPVPEELRAEEVGRRVERIKTKVDQEKCPLRRQCHTSKRDRQIEVNHTLDDYKARVRELFTSDQGLVHRSNRPIES